MALILDDIRVAPALIINAPSVFARADFMAWLNDPENTVFTWHQKGSEPQEYSDTIVLVAEHYDGDSSDMPADIWRLICEEVYARNGGPDLSLTKGESVTVRLTNLDA